MSKFKISSQLAFLLLAFAFPAPALPATTAQADVRTYDQLLHIKRYLFQKFRFK